MAAMQQLIPELEQVLGTASAARRGAILRSVTDLFLSGATSYSNDQSALFDVVLSVLIKGMDRQPLVELSGRLATIENPPAEVAAKLAFDDDIMVAQSILKSFRALPDETLVEIAKTKGPGHLLAIAHRKQISEAVSTTLIERGDGQIMRMVAANPDTQISQIGFVKLLSEAKRDRELAQLISARKDVPSELQPFLKLLAI